MKQLVIKRPKGLSKQKICQYLQINRSSLYYKPKGETKMNVEIMNKMDGYTLEHPTAGVLTMRNMLYLQGIIANVKRIRRLMNIMNIKPIYPQKNLTKQGKTNYVKPYLLRSLDITRPNQVWSTDISYIPMKQGFLYLYAIIDVYSRYIVGWRLTNTLAAYNCTELMDECIKAHGNPEIVNTDQGSQYTCSGWINYLQDHGIKVSMDGRGRCKDNIWIERFWRTIKQEYVYLNPANNGTELYRGIKHYIEYYNNRRPHQRLSRLLPIRQYNAA
jgi:Transposase and inactivated derivatives